MAKQLKDQPVGARMTADMKDEVDTYLALSDMSMGELIRKSVREYIWGHPINQLKKGKR
jgi:hypothetical protein